MLYIQMEKKPHPTSCARDKIPTAYCMNSHLNNSGININV